MTVPEHYPVKVSVCILAYNQRDLFREAIESVVTQKTTFPFEIIVCDDASTDGTSDVLREYVQRYPDLIRPVFRDQNVGHYENYVGAHNLARGEYAAHLDGDDLFLPGKLQQQADFLDSHPDVAAVWHAVRMIDNQARDIGRVCIRDAIAPDGYVSLADWLELGTLGIHSATMYRASARTTTTARLNPIDWFFAVEFLEHGKGYQLPQELGVYRKLVGTSMSSNAASARKVRQHFAGMILYYIEKMPQYRGQLFTLSLLYFLSDVKARHSSMIFMLKPMWESRTFLSPRRFFSAAARFRAVSKAFSGRS